MTEMIISTTPKKNSHQVKVGTNEPIITDLAPNEFFSLSNLSTQNWKCTKVESVPDNFLSDAVITHRAMGKIKNSNVPQIPKTAPSVNTPCKGKIKIVPIITSDISYII